MAESLIGRKVRLTGEAWAKPGWPNIAVGTIVTIIDEQPDEHVVRFRHPGQGVMSVWLDGSRDPSLHRDWAGELIDEQPALEVRPYAVGFLDALLDLEPQDAGEEYDRGYSRGVEARPVTM